MWRIQGSGKLDRRGLACLRALWRWRDAEAKAWDRPSFMVVPNRQLLEWSHNLAEGKSVTLPHHFRTDRIKRFKNTVAAVEALGEDDWPRHPSSKRRKRTRDFERRLDALIADRDRTAGKLDIEGSLIAPRAALESIAAGEADAKELLLQWQLQCLGMEG
jgi:ribonuclease D